MRKFLLTVMLLLALHTQAAAAVWIVGFDATASVPPKEHAVYPDIVRSTVLEFAQPGDTIILLRLDRREAETVVLDERLTHLKRDVKALYEKLRETKQSKDRRGTTDFSLVIEHARQRIELDRRLKGTAATERYVIVFVTDGVHDSKNQIESRPIPAETDWRMLFVGVQPKTEEQIRRLCTQAGLATQERIVVVPFDQWSGVVSALPEFFGQPVNLALRKALSRLSQSAGNGSAPSHP